jgi:hypothetical protein
MKNRFGCRPLGRILVTVIALAAGVQTWAASTPADKDKTDALLATMQDEMQRAQTNLGKLDPAPYFLSYSVYDQSMVLD